MKIGGFGELESIRKTLQKDAGVSQSIQEEQAERSSASQADAVEISDQAKVLGKLSKTSDVRSEELSRVKEKLDDGTLVTDESVREGVSKLLGNLLE